ncbi:hypothetical protein GCM10007989_07320 [Devosia pacifica]|uniref:Uncharacterized protein n=1 Tax=Devosia pacifica TaxID=1335967 RepID=A0A918RZQ2_9HYPH|nr:hypothetical protein [Devosia pacifica]GHA15103.1 hypothetical protein GCM10007989_07320 [Devosia pacifica]
MVDLPPGFRITQQGAPRQPNPAIPEGFRVVQPGQQSRPSTGPSIQVGGRTISMDEYMSMSDEERQAIRAGIAQANPSVDPVTEPSAQPQEQRDEWRRGTLAPVEVNRSTGAFRPAVPQIAMDAWSAITLPGDVARGDVSDFDPGVGFQNMSEQSLDRAASLAGGMAPGAPVGRPGVFSTSTGQRVPTHVQRALERGGIRAEEVGPRVSQMGPGAIAADISPSMQSLAMGAAERPGMGQAEIAQLLMGRAAGARGRIQSQVDDVLGPSVSRGEWSADLDALRAATSPLYRESFSRAGPVNVMGIAARIDEMIPNYTGRAQRRLQQIQRDLYEGDSLTTNPARLFSLRNELDDMLDDPNIGRVREVIGDVRGMVDSELAQRVPDIKRADAQWQEIARQSEAFDQGRKMFGGGAEAIDPRDYERMQVTASQPSGVAPGPSAAPMAMRQGARNEIDRLIGTGSRNRTSLAAAIRGEGGWNRDKLAQTFGDDRADEVIRLFDNEATMALTEERVTGGAVTGLRRAAGEDLRPRQQEAPIFQGPTGIDIGNLLRRGASRATGGITERIAERQNDEILRSLMETGGWYENRSTPETLAIIRALLTTGAAEDASIEESLQGLIRWQ